MTESTGNIFNGNKSHIRDLLFLTLPIVAGQLGQMLIGAGDVYIASLYETEAVAAIGISLSLSNPVFLFGIGLCMGISPKISIEAGEGKRVNHRLATLLTYAVFNGVSLGGVAILWNQFVPILGYETTLVPKIQQYNFIVAFSFVFAFIFQAIREFLMAQNDIWFSNIISIIAILVNLALNTTFVFGSESLGIPEMGVVGVAYASLSIRFLLALTILSYALLKKFELFKVDLNYFKETFFFSLPIATMFFFEVASFCLVGVLAGRLGVVPAATNNLILTVASISFMIPLSLSGASAVRVGYYYGKRDIQNIRGAIQASLKLTAYFSLTAASLFILFPQTLMNWISKDPAVIELGGKLLFLVALFQVSDFFQIVLTGILRGLKRTKAAGYTVIIGHWIFGIPIGTLLTFYFNVGLPGMWIGLVIALSLVSAILAWYLYVQAKLKYRISKS